MKIILYMNSGKQWEPKKQIKMNMCWNEENKYVNKAFVYPLHGGFWNEKTGQTECLDAVKAIDTPTTVLWWHIAWPTNQEWRRGAQGLLYRASEF